MIKQARVVNLNVKVTASDREKLSALANQAGKSLSSFVYENVLAGALRGDAAPAPPTNGSDQDYQELLAEALTFLLAATTTLYPDKAAELVRNEFLSRQMKAYLHGDENGADR